MTAHTTAEMTAMSADMQPSDALPASHPHDTPCCPHAGNAPVTCQCPAGCLSILPGPAPAPAFAPAVFATRDSGSRHGSQRPPLLRPPISA